MLLAAIMAPYLEVTATLLLAVGFVWHLITALKVAFQFITDRESAGPVTAALQLVFEPGREVVIDVLREMIREEAVDDAADVGRDEALAVHLDVFAVLERCDDARIG